MFIRRHHHEVTLLNTTSTADISFMLLVFFLMTSSMNSDKGLSRQLPPTKSEQSAITDINRSNVLQIHLDANDALWIDGQTVADEQLQHEVESFLASRQSQRFMIEVTTDRRTSYDAYFNMQNTIVAAFHTLRETMAQKQFGIHFTQCNDQQRNIITQRYPLRISEAVTDNITIPTSPKATSATEKGGRP